MGHAGNAVGTSITDSEWFATGLRPRDDKSELGEGMCYLSLRGGSASDRRGNPSCPGGWAAGCMFGCCFTVDRHGLSALAIKRNSCKIDQTGLS